MLARLTAVAAVLACLATGCSGTEQRPPSGDPGVPTLRPQVLAEIPHDRAAFTQGLELVDGVLYEGTGLEGQSEVRATDPADGAVRERMKLPGEFFGEGITVVGDRIWQITWQNGVAIERDRSTLEERRRVTYAGEGWGLCHDGTRLVMSDGTDKLTFRDPATFAETGEVRVRDARGPVVKLNELECVNGAVYANVWETDRIVRIDPASGGVTAVVDLAGLLPEGERAGADVLNGIAAVPGTDEFIVTGKLWPKLFRVRFATSG
ncbi:glutaminyl-peptide cyclotransferase [Actinokineospora globicatena]|uniref:glutaminyl-peptide cyclotransferase n=1 Tax=Actinokineospora globicatena TaxID=103729 RepID=UPI0024A312FB|nr:Glutamine cyclotransferase [Actinokineospora globicatena]GLW77603.1 glutaminyl-peptide cyclotransferase [Actinokineospora globicatena]GLW84437.1 glutaminyl-peptide cyclotransferase [Actinokineospora globicatena]